jgi:hypothetical protein
LCYCLVMLFSLLLFICCSIVLCSLPPPICLLPSGTLCFILVAMAYYFIGFFLPSSIWLLPNDYMHSIMQHPMWFIFGDSFSSFPYLYRYLVVLFLLLLQLDGVFPLLFICFSCLVGISFFILFLMAFYGFPSLVCLLLGGIICPYVCCSYCSMVHSPPLVVLLLVVLFLMLLNVCFYLVFCVFFLNALFLILPLSTLFYANCCYILWCMYIPILVMCIIVQY